MRSKVRSPTFQVELKSKPSITPSRESLEMSEEKRESRTSTFFFSNPSFFERRVIQEFLDQIHVRQKHPPTAIPFQTQNVERITLRILCLEQSQVILPFIPNDFPASEASHRNDHFPSLSLLS